MHMSSCNSESNGNVIQTPDQVILSEGLKMISKETSQWWYESSISINSAVGGKAAVTTYKVQILDHLMMHWHAPWHTTVSTQLSSCQHKKSLHSWIIVWQFWPAQLLVTVNMPCHIQPLLAQHQKTAAQSSSSTGNTVHSEAQQRDMSIVTWEQQFLRWSSKARAAVISHKV